MCGQMFHLLIQSRACFRLNHGNLQIKIFRTHQSRCKTSGLFCQVALNIMKKNILVLSALIALSAYVFISCNSGAATNSVSISTEPVTIAKGRDLFQMNCSSCHILSEISLDGIGPQLAGVTEENSVDWL